MFKAFTPLFRWSREGWGLLHLFAVTLVMSIVVGSACAFFLWSLDRVTALRFEHPSLLFGLPLGGFFVGLLYHSYGRTVEGGNNLIMDEIHEPGGGVPLRMAPLVLIGTLVTHLFGGSAGREGTAVQMGGSLAQGCGSILRLPREHYRTLLMGGIAAGFGAVFGTPLAGAIFALEVLTIGRLDYRALLPCFVAALAGDRSCQAWGIIHTHYSISSPIGLAGFPFHLELSLLGKVVLASVGFGLVSTLFAASTHWLSGQWKKLIGYAPLRPALGGSLVIALVYLAGTRDYLGLGVIAPEPNAVTILSFFTSAEWHPWSWLWKLLFTVVTLSSGFKGGEVTPLFFIGAAFGNCLAGNLGAPLDLFAALGFLAVFAGATNTPLACTLMGVELFGSTHLVYMATACFVSYLCSGNTGIYRAQRVGVAKRRLQESPLAPPQAWP